MAFPPTLRAEDQRVAVVALELVDVVEVLEDLEQASKSPRTDSGRRTA